MSTWGRATGRTVAVPHESSAVRQARHAVADQLVAAGVSERDREDAVLVVSELVSNSVKHAQPLPGDGIVVSLQVSTDVLHLEITDGGAGTVPRASVAAFSETGGRGLDIVRTVGTKWGVTETRDAVTVWVDLPRHGPATTALPLQNGRAH